MTRSLLLLLLAAASCAQPQNQPQFPNREADWVGHDFQFKSGETMSELHLHDTIAMTGPDARTTQIFVLMGDRSRPGSSPLGPPARSLLRGVPPPSSVA